MEQGTRVVATGALNLPRTLVCERTHSRTPAHTTTPRSTRVSTPNTLLWVYLFVHVNILCINTPLHAHSILTFGYLGYSVSNNDKTLAYPWNNLIHDGNGTKL